MKINYNIETKYNPGDIVCFEYYNEEEQKLDIGIVISVRVKQQNNQKLDINYKIGVFNEKILGIEFKFANEANIFSSIDDEIYKRMKNFYNSYK